MSLGHFYQPIAKQIGEPHVRTEKTDDQTTPAKPATEETRGNPNDPRWKAADNLAQDNEAALDKSDQSKKKEQAGG